MNYCFTGPRAVTYGQGIKIERIVAKIDGETYHVGDATGVDAIVVKVLWSERKNPHIYRAEGKQAWQLAQRSKYMVDRCAKLGNAKLIAFPNKACPQGVKPGQTFSGKGSGTWGTIAYAKYLGMAIELFPLEKSVSEPDWMREEQLTLF